MGFLYLPQRSFSGCIAGSLLSLVSVSSSVFPPSEAEVTGEQELLLEATREERQRAPSQWEEAAVQQWGGGVGQQMEKE